MPAINIESTTIFFPFGQFCFDSWLCLTGFKTYMSAVYEFKGENGLNGFENTRARHIKQLRQLHATTQTELRKYKVFGTNLKKFK